MGGMQKWPKFLSQWMHVYCFIWLSWYSEARQKQLEIKETVSKRSTEHGEANAQQPCTLTAALLSASEFPGGSAAGPSDGNSSCVVITWWMPQNHTHLPQSGVVSTRKHELFLTAQMYSAGVRAGLHQRGSLTNTRSYWSVESAAEFVYRSK